MHPFLLTLAWLSLHAGGTAYAQELGEPPRRPDSTPIPQAKTSHRDASLNATFATWVDTSNRAAARTFYLNSYLPTVSVPTGWVGNVTTGVSGTTSATYKDAVSTRINVVRAFAGIPPVITIDPAKSAQDQEAAMMMSVNNQLNHYPPSSWINYTANGAAAAAQSNLCLGLTLQYDAGCVQTYIQDFGSSNYLLGHRRWVLYPQTQVMGTGDVSPSGGTPKNANALWVFDSHLNDARPPTRDGFVAWPPQGYVPFDFVYPRWSLSYPNADFSSATVTMTQGGIQIPVRLEVVTSGYGENTLAWVPNNLDANSSYVPLRPASDIMYGVQISNVKGTAVPTSFNYTVIAFDPAPSPVSITVNSSPSNLGLFVDGTFYTSNTFQWIPGDIHTLSYASYAPSGGIQYGFGGWSDGGGTAHSIVVPNAAGIYTVTYNTQYLLTSAANPAAAGSIGLSPVSPDGYYAAGTSVQLNATPATGYTFSSFSGAISGSTNPQTVIMNAPRAVTANFSIGSTVRPGFDFNADNKPDILWQLPSTGELWVWYMNGAAYAGASSISPPTAWRVPGAADFNADGKPDILWQNPTTGELWVWFMNGASWAGQTQISPATSWRVVATGDFNGDGKPDILWQHPTTGELWVWYLNGAAYAGAAQVSPPTAWTVAGSADFNGDGKLDLLWQHPSSGELWVWFMNGSSWAGQAQVSPATAWKVAGTGDFNADGKPDILWQLPATGELWTWFMNGAAYGSAAQIGGVTPWKAIGLR